MELSNYKLLGDDIKSKSLKNIYPIDSYASGDNAIYEKCAKKTGFITMPLQQMQQMGLHNTEETKKAFNDCVAKNGGHNFWDELEKNAGGLLNLGNSIFGWLGSKKNNGGNNTQQGGNNGNTGQYGNYNDGNNNDFNEHDKFFGMPKPLGIGVTIVSIIAVGATITYVIKKNLSK